MIKLLIQKLKKFNTIFYKLILSNIILTTVILIVFGVTNFNFFKFKYENQIININENHVKYLKDYINNSIINYTTELVYNTFKNPKNDELKYFFYNDININQKNILTCMDIMKPLINSELMSSINVYYKKSDVLISSSYGLKYLNSGTGSTDVDISWINTAKSSKASKLWTITKIDNSYFSDFYITYITQYPIITNSDLPLGYISVNINEYVFYKNLLDRYSINGGEIFILDDKGYIVSHKDKNMLMNNVISEQYIKNIYLSDDGNYRTLYNNTESIVSYTTISSNKWKIVSIIPINIYFQYIYLLRKNVLYLIVLLLIISIILTNLFTSKIYRPLKILTYSTKKFLKLNNNELEFDEYKIINRTINELSSKVSDLEDTININIDVIRYNTLNNIIFDKYETELDIINSLNLASIDFPYMNFCTIIVYTENNILNKLTIENKEFIKYNIINKINNLIINNVKLHCFETYDKSILLIVNMYCEEDLNILVNKLLSISKNIKQDFNISLFYYIGKSYDSLLNIKNSFEESKQTEIYKYIYPDKQFINYDDIYLQNNNELSCNSNMLLDKFYKQISSHIKLQNLSGFNQTINEIISIIKKENYSYEETINHLWKIIDTIKFTLTQLSFDIQDFVSYNIYDYFTGIQNINEFEEWINNVFKDICDKLSEKTSVTDFEYIQTIKKYITDHIEDDICLETVSKNLYISSHYLCKIFKKETNMGFNSFVTQCKMEKAKYYIINSDININEISAKLDYKNTSYFIKMFKEAYGKTPKQYRYDLTISNPEICTDK